MVLAAVVGLTVRLEAQGGRAASELGFGAASRALVLNVTYEPLSVVAGRRAAVLVLADKADLVHESGIELHSERLVIEVPSVIQPASSCGCPTTGTSRSAGGRCSCAISTSASTARGPPRPSTTSSPAVGAGCTAGRTSWPPAAGATCTRATGCSSTHMALRRRPTMARRYTWIITSVGAVEAWEPYLQAA